MNRIATALILSASVFGVAQVGELDYPPAIESASALSHTQVQAELQAARTQGLMAAGEQDYPIAAYAAASTVSREQVRDELAAARAQGLTESGELAYPPVAG